MRSRQSSDVAPPVSAGGGLKRRAKSHRHNDRRATGIEPPADELRNKAISGPNSNKMNPLAPTNRTHFPPRKPPPGPDPSPDTKGFELRAES
jgi:hypothetical protein